MKDIIFSIHSNKPIYQQVYEQLSSQIMLKEILPNTQLPSIRKTAIELRVSIITIKKAWNMLEQNKFIYTIAGKGSYVAENSDVTLQDKKTELIQQDLRNIIETSKNLGITEEELQYLVNKLYHSK